MRSTGMLCNPPEDQTLLRLGGDFIERDLNDLGQSVAGDPRTDFGRVFRIFRAQV